MCDMEKIYKWLYFKYKSKLMIYIEKNIMIKNCLHYSIDITVPSLFILCLFFLTGQ